MDKTTVTGYEPVKVDIGGTVGYLWLHRADGCDMTVADESATQPPKTCPWCTPLESDTEGPWVLLHVPTHHGIEVLTASA